MILEPGADFCIAATGAHRRSSVFMPYEVLSANGVRAVRTVPHSRLLEPSNAGRSLQLLIEKLYAAFRYAPDAFGAPSTMEATKLRVAEAVGLALICNRDANTLPGRPTVPRTQIMQTALDVIDGCCGESLSVCKLANMSGVSERTLRTAFNEYFGVGPTRYLKIRTLREARKLLKAADPFATTVTDIAVGLGVWEFGRFSRDYKMLFDELPSETLRK
jgi:AraC family ethanolamine operon transcriptional activator